MAGSEAILVQLDPLMDTHHQQIMALAARYRLPAIYDNRRVLALTSQVDGGLISYGADIRDMGRTGASYVDRILRGALPKDLPVDQASRFQLVINLKTAKAPGLTISPSLLARRTR